MILFEEDPAPLLLPLTLREAEARTALGLRVEVRQEEAGEVYYLPRTSGTTSADRGDLRRSADCLRADLEALVVGTKMPASLDAAVIQQVTRDLTRAQGAVTHLLEHMAAAARSHVKELRALGAAEAEDEWITY